MELYTTLDEAISVARETFLADNPDMDEGSVAIAQFSLQKYVMQDGEDMWQAEFAASQDQQGECLPILFDEAAQSIWDDEYEEDELLGAWLPDNTLHEWDDGEFQHTPSLDSEEGLAAADEWQDDNTDSERW